MSVSFGKHCGLKYNQIVTNTSVPRQRYMRLERVPHMHSLKAHSNGDWAELGVMQHSTDREH